MNYPEQTIEQFRHYIVDFDNDIEEIKDIEFKINKWVNRGVDINSAINPLQAQIATWENKMRTLQNQLESNIKNLKSVDDRITSNSSFTMDSLDNFSGNLEKWDYLFSQYKLVLQNLKEDTRTLYEIDSQIKRFHNLGVELGDAITKIQNQNDNIINTIKNSMEDLQKLIEEVKIESGKITDTQEMALDNQLEDNNQPQNKYWAFYDKMNVDGESFSLNINHAYWDSQKDGLDILNHTHLNYISRRSTIYNASVGEVQVHATPEKPINYIYYGYDKNNLVKLKVRDTQWGSYYVDSGNCLIQVYFGSTQVMDNGTNSRKYFSELYKQRNNEDYQNGATTKNKWYLIAACEEIMDLTNIIYRGE